MHIEKHFSNTIHNNEFLQVKIMPLQQLYDIITHIEFLFF